MSKLDMRAIRVCGLRSDRKAILERLQRLGVVEIAEAPLPDELFTREDKERQAQIFDRTAQTALDAIRAVDEQVPHKKGLLDSYRGRRVLTEAEYAAYVDDADKWIKRCREVLTAKSERAESAAECVRIGAAIDQLAPWQTLDVPLPYKGTRTTVMLFGILPAAYTADSLSAALAGQDPALLFETEILSSGSRTCVSLICPKEQKTAAEQALRALGAERPPVTSDRPPAEQMAALRQKLADEKQRQKDLAETVAAAAADRDAFEVCADYYALRAEKYRAIGKLAHTRHTFTVTGYVPAPDEERVREALEPLGAVVETAEADPETAPVALKNGAFAKPAESLLAMYSMPSAGDIDPTPLMAFFFYFFFGMMFSDAGYGLLMILATTFVLVKYKPEPAQANSMRMFRYCGIFTTLWGLVYGSFFGDLPTVIAKTFFNTDWTLPHLIDPINDAIVLLGLSIFLGYIQIMIAMGVKAILSWRAGDRLGALFDTATWMLFWTGVVFLAAGMLFLAPLKTVGAVMMIVAALGIIVMGGRASKGPMRIVKGVTGLYDVTGYFGDLMSYSRLMALGITTGVMGQVFNMLSTLAGKSVAGVIFMVIILIIGHLINFGLNALGAYVHSMRLQYVEMFSKFYEGGGRLFRPFAFDSHYIRLQEEDQQ